MASSTWHARRNKGFVQRHTLPLVFVGFGVLVLIMAVVLALSTGERADSQQFDFTLATLNGGSVSLADYRGKTVAINFWATWCPPCRAEMPALDEYYREHMDEDFVLLAVNVGETPQQAQSFIQQNGFTFPVALDPESKLSDRVGTTGYPTTLIVNPQGQITYRHTGLITLQVLHAKVQEARQEY